MPCFNMMKSANTRRENRDVKISQSNLMDKAKEAAHRLFKNWASNDIREESEDQDW